MEKRMEALAVLSAAHKIGLDKIEMLQNLVDEAPIVDLAAARQTLGVLFEFIDGELKGHFQQEEDILFPALEEPLAGPGPIRIDGEESDFCYFLFCEAPCRVYGPLAIYRRDHAMIWNAIDKLRATHQELDRGVAGEEIRHRLEQSGAEVAWLLGSHIAKEDEVLLPKAAEVLSGELLAEIDRALAPAA